jgi:hypothetical protein
MRYQTGNATAKALVILLVSLAAGTLAGYSVMSYIHTNSDHYRIYGGGE